MVGKKNGYIIYLCEERGINVHDRTRKQYYSMLAFLGLFSLALILFFYSYLILATEANARFE